MSVGEKMRKEILDKRCRLKCYEMMRKWAPMRLIWLPWRIRVSERRKKLGMVSLAEKGTER